MEQLGFIGLGNMGGAICRALVNKGQSVTVFDLSQKALEQFAGKAAVAKDAVDVLEKSDIVFLSLPASKQVVPILDAYLHHGVAGKTVVDTSTSYPETTREYHEKFKEAGGNLVDLAISELRRTRSRVSCWHSSAVIRSSMNGWPPSCNALRTAIPIWAAAAAATWRRSFSTLWPCLM